MPIEHRHVIKKDLERNNGTPAPDGTFGFVCVPVAVLPEGGERPLPEEFRSTDWPTRKICEERLAQHQAEHDKGTPVPPARELLAKHGYLPDGKGGTRKMTDAELLAHVGAK